MKIGLFCAGVGRTAKGDFIQTAAAAAERTGFSTFWFGEHVILFDEYKSKYPYARPGTNEVGVPNPVSPLCDPVVAMTWAAAATSKIELSTAVMILPQYNPLILAKALATLDNFSGGRIMLGAGVGWCQEEFEALGVAWPKRGKRTDEYVGALRALWKDQAASFHGETVNFDRVYSNPKPVRNGEIPIAFGGDTEAAMRRIAKMGDGWLPVSLSAEEAPQKVAQLHSMTKEYGRDPSKIRIIKAITSATTIDELKRFRDAGISEFTLRSFSEFPRTENGTVEGIEDLARRFIDTTAKL